MNTCYSAFGWRHPLWKLELFEKAIKRNTAWDDDAVWKSITVENLTSFCHKAEGMCNLASYLWISTYRLLNAGKILHFTISCTDISVCNPKFYVVHMLWNDYTLDLLLSFTLMQWKIAYKKLWRFWLSCITALITVNVRTSKLIQRQSMTLVEWYNNF